jgi:hypothetical protein
MGNTNPYPLAPFCLFFYLLGPPFTIDPTLGGSLAFHHGTSLCDSAPTTPKYLHFQHYSLLFL